jgi:Cu(I)/Ag(I) efflux system membrane protein CusA/SilA
VIGWIIGWSIRNRVLVAVVGLLLAAWGIYAASIAPIDAIPDLSENQIIVHAEWPGHGPGDVEDQITAPLRLELNGLPGVKSIRSSSDVGASTLWMILEDSADIAAIRGELADRLSSAGSGPLLPDGVRARLAPDGLATGQIFWYTVEGGGLDLGRLRMIQDWYVKPQLSSVAGVAEVASIGGMAPELQIEADPVRLRAQQVSMSDLVAAVRAANGSSSGGVVHRANAEFLVRGINWLGDRDGSFQPEAALEDLRRVVVPTLDGRVVLLEDVATEAFGPQPRRGALEKDGVEVTGGVVLMKRGANPLQVTERLKAKIKELAAGLPPGVKIIPMYDRTPLIRGVIGTVSGTIFEAMVSATLCIILVLKHFRAALIIALTLPLTVLSSFGVLEILRLLKIADVPLNAMSLAGLAISIGVLVDSAIVMTENVLHTLRQRYGDQPVRGDASNLIEAACRQVGRPISFAILIILLSFLPVFALGGLEGKMFRPLATTKTLAMIASGALAITLVPALCAMLIRGRIRPETDSRIVRGVIEVYRPILEYLLDRPVPLLWVLAVTFLLAAAAVGPSWLFLATLAAALLTVGLASRTAAGTLIATGSLVLIALAARSTMTPLGREFLAPLDEGMVMDMPISIPRVPISQGVDDLKARDMVLCRFPEVAMVVGKLGRAETPTDPAPLDMIETMVEFHPREFWPARSLDPSAARRQVRAVSDAMTRRGLVAPLDDGSLSEVADAALRIFDAQMREAAYQKMKESFRASGLFDEATWRLDGLTDAALQYWRDRVREINADLLARAPGLFTRIAIEEVLSRADVLDPNLTDYMAALRRARASASVATHHAAGQGEHAMSRTATMPPGLPEQPVLHALQEELASPFAQGLVLWRKSREALIGFDGELDRAVPMPGWTNIWTMPIQNRVDMLSTGVNTTIGIRVLGDQLNGVAEISQQVAQVVKKVPGAVDVVADPIRGKGVIEVRANRAQAARLGVEVGEINSVVEAAIGGAIATTVVAGRERLPVRVRYARAFREDEESVRSLLVRSQPPGSAESPRLIPLAEVADIRVTEGAATIKGESSLLRNYVRLNVRDRDVNEFVDEARRLVQEQVALPEGFYLEWTGQFEHEVRAGRTLAIVIPIILLVILGILYATYRDLGDAFLMMLAMPGAIAGGVICQWLFGAKFSVTVWIGYIACFGMATSTGIIMLVYLRDALERAGGLGGVDEAGLRRAVLDGAVKRLRPKLLTEATLILGLAPMLWAGGVGGEVIRPMAAPVLGGVLVADEVIDLLLPVLFYRVRRGRLRRLAAGRDQRAPLAVAS